MLSKRTQPYGTTIFSEMTALAQEHGAINLGQGFPDFAAPDFLKRAAQEAIAADINQYAPSNGRSNLRHALSQKMNRDYALFVDPDRDITITHGATEAIFTTILGLVDPGDEVILFEPYFDIYLPSITFAGGIPHTYTLRPPDWFIDGDELARLFSDKTKLILVNSPHNPTGKVFSHAELQIIANLCQKHNVIAVTDEVYEHLVFDAHKHIPLATLPGMAERTVTISSIGKTFSVTGWKVGWTIATPTLSEGIRRVHQQTTFSGATPLQEAAVTALNAPNSYFKEFLALYSQKRGFLFNALLEAGLKPILPAGTYFIMTQIDNFDFPDDRAFCHYLTKEIGVTAIPPGSFYQNPVDGAKLARFAFCKSEAALATAATRLVTLGFDHMSKQSLNWL